MCVIQWGQRYRHRGSLKVRWKDIEGICEQVEKYVDKCKDWHLKDVLHEPSSCVVRKCMYMMIYVPVVFFLYLTNYTLSFLHELEGKRLWKFTSLLLSFNVLSLYFQTSDPLISSYKYGSLTRIPEFVEFRERLNNSLHFALVTAEQMLMDLTLDVSIFLVHHN